MKAGCKVKICGITNLEDARLAAAEGADYIGVVVDVSFSPRSLTIEQAGKIFASPYRPTVALVHQMSFTKLELLISSLKPFAVQFLSPAAHVIVRAKKIYPGVQMWQSIHLPPADEQVNRPEIERLVRECSEAGADLIVFDTAAVISGSKRFGGTGRQSNWQLVKQLVKNCPLPAFLAGGINPSNAAQAIAFVKPAGIDLCSGVEALPGQKSLNKLRALMTEVRKENAL